MGTSTWLGLFSASLTPPVGLLAQQCACFCLYYKTVKSDWNLLYLEVRNKIRVCRIARCPFTFVVAMLCNHLPLLKRTIYMVLSANCPVFFLWPVLPSIGGFSRKKHKYYELPKVSSDLETVPLKITCWMKTHSFTGSVIRKHPNTMKWRKEMWKKMQISDLLCAVHAYCNSEEAPKWTVRNLSETRDAGGE